MRALIITFTISCITLAALGCYGGSGRREGADAATEAGADARTASDTGAATDTGTATDTGAVTDTGTAIDAGAVTDAGTATDTGTDTDAGSYTDAASATDTGFDAGPRDVRPDDLLQPASPRMIPYTLYCFDAISVLRTADASAYLLPGHDPRLSIRSSNPAVASVSEAGDCIGIGVIALSVGSAVLTVRYQDGPIVLEAPTLARVRAGAPFDLRPYLDLARDRELRFNRGSTIDLPVGGDRAVTFTRGPFAAAGGGSLSTLRYVYRWMSMEAMAPGVISIAPDSMRDRGASNQPNLSWSVSGLAPGQTGVRFRYRSPTGTVLASTEIDAANGIRVAPMGALFDLEVSVEPGDEEHLIDARCEGSKCTLPPGHCRDGLALGRYDSDADGSSDYLAYVTDSATWTGDAELEVDGHRICGLRRGLGQTRACVGALCRNAYVVVADDGEILALRIDPLRPAFRRDTTSRPFCASLRVLADLRDGSTWDVTTWPLVEFVPESAGGFAFFPERDDEGGIRLDAMGRLCASCQYEGRVWVNMFPSYTNMQVACDLGAD